jgi:hypothetical protein
LFGMFDGAKCFSVYLTGEWHALWYGVRIPTEQDKERLKTALCVLGLDLPVIAAAKWSGKSECYEGIRFYDEAGNETET